MLISQTKSTYLKELFDRGNYEEFQECVKLIFNEPLCINFIDIITNKVKQGLTMDNIISFHNKYPNKSIFCLFGFLSDKINNVEKILPS